MYQNDLNDLVWLSREAGSRTDFVQAGGGNTSVKFSDGMMAIKASGYLLKDMTPTSGFAAVDGAAMKAYHETNHEGVADFNKDSMDKAIASIRPVNGETSARPSVEFGFHSILDKFVLHLHPICANVIVCTDDPEARLREVFDGFDLRYVVVPYVMPGYPLTKAMQSAIARYQAETGQSPQAIFMVNHGMTTTAPTAQEAYELMDRANKRIQEKLALADLPPVAITPCDGGFKSANTWLKNALRDPSFAHAIKYEPLIPDQIVYLMNDISLDADADTKIVVANDEIFYRANEVQAAALEETLSAAVYVLRAIQSLGWKPQPLSETDCADILGWDSEKYRKHIMANQ